MKYYLDTCIWRDYFENREDNFRPLGEWALSLLKQIIQNKDIVFISDFSIQELKIKYSEQEINSILKIIQAQNLLINLQTNDFQIKEAAKLCKERNVAFADALHAVLSRDNNAILITRDVHFTELLDLVDIKKPEELI